MAKWKDLSNQKGNTVIWAKAWFTFQLWNVQIYISTNLSLIYSEFILKRQVATKSNMTQGHKFCKQKESKNWLDVYNKAS